MSCCLLLAPSIWLPSADPGSAAPRPSVRPSVRPCVRACVQDNRPGGGGSRETFRKGKFAESKVKDVTGAPVTVRIGETLTPLHSPEHRWIFFP